MSEGSTPKGRFVALLLGTFLAAVATESIARWVFPEWAPRSARLASFWQYDERLGWKHVPGAIGRFNSHGFDIVVQINSQGYRGPERDYVRNGEVGRVLVLGDSMIFGFGVEYEEMFTTILERRLPNVEVINLGHAAGTKRLNRPAKKLGRLGRYSQPINEQGLVISIQSMQKDPQSVGQYVGDDSVAIRTPMRLIVQV